MGVFHRLEQFVIKVFKTTVEVFFEALQLSPNAQGYVSGSITELLLKRHLQNLGFEVKRIREKWEGRKHPQHHGDFYFCRPQAPWFVLESKGVKSNSEKWHKLYNYDRLIKFLYDHSDKISWIDNEQGKEPQIIQWVNENLPLMQTTYRNTLYDYEEIQKYLRNAPRRATNKSRAIQELSRFSREEIAAMIDERLNYVLSKVKVLETHFVSDTSGSNERTQATPRKDEFNLISVDIFLRYTEHKFLFANPKQLESSGDDANHLQQNYIMGFVFTQANGTVALDLTDEWHENFIDAYETLHQDDAINEVDMQIDNRNIVIDA